MNMKKAILGLVASVAVAVTLAAPSHAQGQQTFASITGAGAGSSNVFTYNSGAAGGFSITPGAQFLASFLPTFTTNGPATVTFTGLTNVGTVSGAGTVSNPYTQELSGGSFDVVSGGSTLLTGTFGGGNLLEGVSGASTAAITNQLNNVTYTGGSYFTSSGLSNPGSFSISMTSVTPAVGVSGGYINSFKAGGTGTFSATSAVPEPATVVPFTLGGLGLLGLIVRKSRRTNGAAA